MTVSISACAPAESFPKRVRASIDTTATGPIDPTDPIDHWRKEGTWPKEYFKQDTMNHLLPRKRSTPFLWRKRSEGSLYASSTTPSDQKPREGKSVPYHDPRYSLLLEIKGSFMHESDLGITTKSKDMCSALLQEPQTVPTESLFRDDIFKRTCQNLQDRNKAKVIQDIARLIVPSAESLATFGAGASPLDILVESVNEGWGNSIPLTGACLRPDYSVGFKWEAFSREQHEKLSPFVGDFIAGDQSYLMATYYMYFPFLTCGTADLDGKDKWTAYTFTKNIYDIWMPTHFKRLCSVIDSLPTGLDSDVPPLQQNSGLSQDLESHHRSGSVAPTEDDTSQPSIAVITSNTSFTQPNALKRRKGNTLK
ncbi:hypothetical protein GQ44DRAFT_629706 [Phaeosphaeriaceae sp. PMI808]|nr:hypothetical protein GQ44DRAFT_629706 [Phaeosphaeriaceae sp. PMI808]